MSKPSRINLKNYNTENFIESWRKNFQNFVSRWTSHNHNSQRLVQTASRQGKMDGSAHLFQFQFVWVNNEKSGSVTSRQFGNNALGRGAISRFHESVEEAWSILQCACACEKEKERTWEKKKGWIDRNEPVAQRAILHGWTTMLDYAILLNGTISMNHNRFPLMSLKGWSIITQCSILERPLQPEISRNGE